MKAAVKVLLKQWFVLLTSTTYLSVILRSCLLRKGTRSWGGGLNSRDVGVAAGETVSNANYHLVSEQVLSAAQINTPLPYIFKQKSFPKLHCQLHVHVLKNSHIADVQFSHGNKEMKLFSISITSIMSRTFHYTDRMESFTLEIHPHHIIYSTLQTI